MASKNQIAVYPDDETRAGIRDYQEEHSVTKSNAAVDLIEMGLQAHNGGVFSMLYWELAKLTGVVGIILLALYANGESLTLPLYFYGLMLVAASFLFMLADRYNFSVLALVRSSDDAARVSRHGN